MRRRARENPLSITTPEKIAIGVGLAGGVAAAIYYATRPAAAASSSGGTSVPITAVPTSVVLQPGAQTITMQVGVPLSLTLPPGAVWGAGITNAGTSTPIVIPAPAAADAGQSSAVPAIPWVDASKAAQSTVLTIGVVPAGTVSAPIKKLTLQRETVATMAKPRRYDSGGSSANPSLDSETSGGTQQFTRTSASGNGGSSSGGSTGQALKM